MIKLAAFQSEYQVAQIENVVTNSIEIKQINLEKQKMSSIQPYNDPTISDHDLLIRRITKHHIHPREPRLTSTMFNPSTGDNAGISVDIERLMVNDNINPAEFILSEKFIGAIYVRVGDVRNLGLLVGRDPIFDNPYHGEIWPKSDEKITGMTKEKLKEIANWYPECSVPGISIQS